MKKKALVLSGGSVKGAFEAGALRYIFAQGFVPEIITGISVGSLNAAYIAHTVGKMKQENRLDWTRVGEELVHFWKAHITGRGSIVNKRGYIPLILQIAFKNFMGINDNAPLKKIVYNQISKKNIDRSGLELSVGTVNVAEGEIFYHDQAEPDFLDYVVASAAIPFVMPISLIKRNPFYDGALRDSAPLKRAISKKADEIVCVLCHSRELMPIPDFQYGNFQRLALRAIDIHSNEIVNTDIDWCLECNEHLPHDGSPQAEGILKGYRKLDLKVIRPEQQIQVELEHFTSDDILRMIDNGYEMARKHWHAPAGNP